METILLEGTFLKPKQPPKLPPWRRALEILIVGTSVGLAVILVRAFTDEGSPLRTLAFILAAIALTTLHFVLRQSVRDMAPSKPLRMAVRRQRPSFDDLFASEADDSWTGLAEPPPEVRRERL